MFSSSVVPVENANNVLSSFTSNLDYDGVRFRLPRKVAERPQAFLSML